MKLVKGFLTKDPDKRITLEEAVNDTWFKSKIKSMSHKVSEVNASKAIDKMKAYKDANKFTKAIRMCMNKLYTSASLEDLKATFLEYDDNKNGVLDHDEFSKVLMKYGFEMSEVEQVIEAVDLNGDGEIEFSEFITGCSNFDTANLFVASEVIFDMIDRDGSGRMDKDEFKKFFTSQNIHYNMTELDNIFNELDEDGDGTVDMEEFSAKFKTYFQ